MVQQKSQSRTVRVAAVQYAPDLESTEGTLHRVLSAVAARYTRKHLDVKGAIM